MVLALARRSLTRSTKLKFLDLHKCETRANFKEKNNKKIQYFKRVFNLFKFDSVVKGFVKNVRSSDYPGSLLKQRKLTMSTNESPIYGKTCV